MSDALKNVEGSAVISSVSTNAYAPDFFVFLFFLLRLCLLLLRFLTYFFSSFSSTGLALGLPSASSSGADSASSSSDFDFLFLTSPDFLVFLFFLLRLFLLRCSVLEEDAPVAPFVISDAAAFPPPRFFIFLPFLYTVPAGPEPSPAEDTPVAALVPLVFFSEGESGVLSAPLAIADLSEP